MHVYYVNNLLGTNTPTTFNQNNKNTQNQNNQSKKIINSFNQSQEHSKSKLI
jgi:hypothetical protein